MSVFSFEYEQSLTEAAQNLMRLVQDVSDVPQENFMWRSRLSAFDERSFFSSVRGVPRIAFKSRDRDVEFFGLGASDLISKHDDQEADTLLHVMNKSRELFEDQYYFGAIRFDDQMPTNSEWQNFNGKLFILPMLSVKKKAGFFELCLNYRSDGHLSRTEWLDHARTLLHVLMQTSESSSDKIDLIFGDYEPTEPEYLGQVKKALDDLAADSAQRKKVVLGRRRMIAFKSPCDPAELFFKLKDSSRGAFLFFIDAGKGSAFFGASPELLYRRQGRYLTTESLAGTRPRSADKTHDEKLKQELFSSFKDNREHALVSLHIEDKLRDFGTTELWTSSLEVMSLAYVQHLLKRYQGMVGLHVDDKIIIDALHPTPAVCGLDKDWALNFIRHHEGFDRGYYAGPIGFFGRDEAEFAVGIRSALYHEQKLFTYAACGIVLGSVGEQEWTELNNKEKNILSIFDHAD